jgi:hypothetical protein
MCEALIYEVGQAGFKQNEGVPLGIISFMAV